MLCKLFFCIHFTCTRVRKKRALQDPALRPWGADYSKESKTSVKDGKNPSNSTLLMCI